MKVKFLTIISVLALMLITLSCSDTPSTVTGKEVLKTEEVLAEQCQDGKDNDEDGKIDCEDEGCKGYVFCQTVTKTENTAVDCNDQNDNDDDGKTDCDDEDCQGFVFCASKVENTAVLCQDGLDTDEDGKTDCEDTDCQGFTFCATTEENTAIVCQDNRDNDDDGKVDCDDEDCQGFTFCDSKVENTAALCNDHQDNDNDGKTDCDDEDCQVFSFCVAGEENTSTACNDQNDNDNDGKIDCEDEDCQGFTFCATTPKVENTAALCQDNIDNDNDLATDCDDTDCQGFTFCQPLLENTAVKCQDNVDNDNDGKVDCDDEDCQGFTFCVVETPVEDTAALCQDNLDNDNDSKVDCDDEDCQGFTFCAVETPVENTAALCQDNLDDDEDGKVDCDDEDCQGFTFCGTFNTEDSSAKCADGEDNDEDGKVDCADEDCWQFSFCNVFNGYPVTDSWGSDWDGMERGKKTWSEAKAICESLGGRLPTATELYRNNASSGSGDIAQTYNTNYLWTLIASYSGNNRVTIRLSDGNVSNGNDSNNQMLNFRCIWPNDDNSGFDSQRCYGNPGEECTKYDRYYNIDNLDRPSLDYVAATNECNFYGASIPTLVQWSENIHQGLVNGTNSWNWVGDAIYWYNGGNGSSIIRWSGIGLPSWRYQVSSMGSLAYHTSRERFRCIGLEDQKAFSTPSTNNCNGADGCFVNNNRSTKLVADSEDRATTNYASAVQICRDLGGRMANSRDFIENIHQGWANGSNNWLWTTDMLYWYSGGYGVNILRWSGTGTERWYHIMSTTFERSGPTNNRNYRCVWEQKRPTLPTCTNDTDVLTWNGTTFDCVVAANGSSNGNANGSEKIDAWGNAWDAVPRSANYEDAKSTCESLGARLPSADELYRIRANNSLVNSNIATGASTDYLWTLIATYNDTQHITVRLSNGGISRQNLTNTNYYRCIWPAKSSDILYGNKCNGVPDSECFETTTMYADSYDRVALDYAAAVNECLFAGGHLMDSNSFVNLVQQGLPNGSNTWNWINEAVYWYSNHYGLHLVRWNNVNTAWHGGSNEQAITSYDSAYPFRCVYNKVLK